ncbi:MAG: helix-turn-helix domain-containing protein [Candidatus Aenigmarchaeota archaeon]|nr:helix-turn-helix domain-containing protein [Candidatus Aenigmarchaeota archaeon]
MILNEIIEGGLLGDGSIRSQDGKYFTFQIVGKDVEFLKWVAKYFNMSGINCWISRNNTDLFMLGFYINTCPYPKFLSLRKEWYTRISGKTVKILPSNLEITPIKLLFWYLGDGCLVRRKNDGNRVPFIVLATNCFSKENIDILIGKLKELGLNFYPVEYKSGFTGKKCGYCLYSNTQDGTPFRFFKFIGLDCPSEIENCTTGAKGIYHEQKFFKDKWPREEDWIKILSNVKDLGPILRKRRFELGLSQNQFGKKIGIRRENIRDVELMKRNFSVKNFRKILEALNLDIPYLLKVLNTQNQ